MEDSNRQQIVESELPFISIFYLIIIIAIIIIILTAYISGTLALVNYANSKLAYSGIIVCIMSIWLSVKFSNEVTKNG